ncbi:MAG: nucleotidyltransferase domain-containing protein [Clostridiaceae bacterium]
MEKTILQYQKAFNNLINYLKKNEKVLAVMVFGSLVTGDLWEESDIDLFVVVDNELNEIKNLYTSENGIPIHIKLLSKGKFISLDSEDLKGGFIHRIFASSRLVFSRDIDITGKYDNGRYYPDLDRERWNMVYLGKLIKNMGICKKYLFNDGVHTSYAVAVNCIEAYAKLYINYSGHMISKDAMSTAMDINPSFKKCVEGLFYKTEDIVKSIEETIEYLDNEVDENIRDITTILISFMKEKDCLLSAADIQKDDIFINYDINMEDILNKLYEKNIIKKEYRNYELEMNKVLLKENVYFI